MNDSWLKTLELTTDNGRFSLCTTLDGRLFGLISVDERLPMDNFRQKWDKRIEAFQIRPGLNRSPSPLDPPMLRTSISTGSSEVPAPKAIGAGDDEVGGSGSGSNPGLQQSATPLTLMLKKQLDHPRYRLRERLGLIPMRLLEVVMVVELMKWSKFV